MADEDNRENLHAVPKDSARVLWQREILLASCARFRRARERDILNNGV